MTAAQAARDLDVHANVLPKWVREAETDPAQAPPGNGQAKPEQPELVRLRKDVVKLKAERDNLRKANASARKASPAVDHYEAGQPRPWSGQTA